MLFREIAALTGILVLIVAACSPENKTVLEPILDGKTDVLSEVNYRGRLEYGGQSEGEFVNDFQFDAWTFQAGAGVGVTIDTTHAGSSSELDNTLFLYGPADQRGEFNGPRLEMDDDSGWGQHARLQNVSLDKQGTYLVVVGTADGQGRGRYRLVLTCLSQDCSPDAPDLEGCPGDVEGWFSMCMESAIYDDLEMRHVALEGCLDESLDLYYDQCEYESVPADWCGLGLEVFEAEVLPACVLIMDEEFPPDNFDTCDQDVLINLEECVEDEMVEAARLLEQAIEYCTDESLFYDLASHLCEYQSPDWCRYEFSTVWDRMIEDCRAKLTDLSPLPEVPSAARIEQMTKQAVESYMYYEDEGYTCEARDFVFEGFDTERNEADQAIGILATSRVEGPYDYCAGYTTYQCTTSFRPSHGEWIDIDSDCQNIGYD
jgi:hypothetical protein